MIFDNETRAVPSSNTKFRFISNVDREQNLFSNYLSAYAKNNNRYQRIAFVTLSFSR